jgi:DNA-binding PucR family transcriptional regulator
VWWIATRRRVIGNRLTVRYRVRRIDKLLSTSLADPEVRLLFWLALRVTEHPA